MIQSGSRFSSTLLDRIFALTLLLYLTNAFVMAAPVLGTLAAVTVCLTGVNLLYLVQNWPITSRLLTSKIVQVWLFMLIGWPVLTILYAPAVNERMLGIQVALTSVFLGAAVYTYRRGWRNMCRLAGVAVALSFVGLVLSRLNPTFFDAVAAITKSRGEYGERAYGFYLQPNMAASSLVLLTALWLAGEGRASSIKRVSVYLALLTAVVFTGSRGGFVTAVAFGLSLALWAPERFTGQPTDIVDSLTRRAARLSAIAIVVAILSFVAADPFGSSADVLSGNYYMQRVESTLSMNSLNDVSADRSGKLRLKSQLQYLDFIRKQPLIGYGLGAQESFYDDGRLFLSSHNSLLETAFQYGIPYIIAFCALLTTFRRRWKVLHAREGWLAFFPSQLGITLLVSSVFVATLPLSRVLFITLGAMVGATLPRRATIGLVAWDRPVSLPARTRQA